MFASKIPEELRELLIELVDGQLGADDAVRLDAILRASPDLQAFYDDFMTLHGMLLWRASPPLGTDPFFGAGTGPFCGERTVYAEKSSAENIEPVAPAPYSVLRTSYSTLSSFLPTTPLGNVAFSYAMSAVLVCIGLWIFSLMSASSPRDAVVEHDPANSQYHTQPNVSAPARESEIVSIARITGMVDCVWVNESEAPFHNKIKLHAKFALKSGLMEITYHTGARVILQGPCTYEADSTAGGYLSLGKLTARVEKKINSNRLAAAPTRRDAMESVDGDSRREGAAAKQSPPLPLLFSVRTPTAVVTDLGTEFAVEVAVEGVCHVETYAGLVTVTRTGEGKPSGEPQMVAAGQAVRIAADSKSVMRLARQRRDDFVTVGQLPNLIHKSRVQDSYNRWRLYSQKQRKDPDLVAYYTFDNQSEAPKRLLNRAEATLGRHDGTLGDGTFSTAPRWAVGRWPEKGALAFDAAKETCVVVPHDDALNLTKAMTIAVWIKIDDPSRIMHLVNKVAKPHVTYNLAWIGKYPAPTIGGALYFDWGWGGVKSRHMLPAESRWIHVAVSCDAAREVVCYIDGAIVGSCSSGTTLATGADVMIGYAPWQKKNAFVGLMDELAIFRRALSAKELYQMATTGKPLP